MSLCNVCYSHIITDSGASYSSYATLSFIICWDGDGGTVPVRCLLGWWWGNSASQMSTAGMVVRHSVGQMSFTGMVMEVQYKSDVICRDEGGAQCWPDVICWHGGWGTVATKCHLMGWWWGHSASQM